MILLRRRPRQKNPSGYLQRLVDRVGSTSTSYYHAIIYSVRNTVQSDYLALWSPITYTGGGGPCVGVPSHCGGNYVGRCADVELRGASQCE